MRTRLLSFVGLLALLLPAALAAQDDTLPDRHDRDRRHPPHHSPGLREVSESESRSRRHGFWLSAGLGFGGESFDAKDGLGWSDSRGGGVASVKLGGTVSPSVLLGAELSGWTRRGYQQDNFDRSLGSIMGIIQWYPAARSDFWLKGGLGYAHSRDREFLGGGSTVNWERDGTALSIGLGYDAPVGRTVSITPMLDFTAQRFRDVDERILSVGVAITFH